MVEVRTRIKAGGEVPGNGEIAHFQSKVKDQQLLRSGSVVLVAAFSAGEAVAADPGTLNISRTLCPPRLQ